MVAVIFASSFVLSRSRRVMPPSDWSPSDYEIKAASWAGWYLCMEVNTPKDADGEGSRLDEGYASSCVLLSLPVFLGVFTIVDYEMLTLPGLTIFSESPASCSFRRDI